MALKMTEATTTVAVLFKFCYPFIVFHARLSLSGRKSNKLEKKGIILGHKEVAEFVFPLASARQF